jgi:hypothetical protein
MLSKVEARNPQGDLLTFLLEDDSTGFLVKDIVGLDPVNATLTKSDFAQQDGTQFNAARREDRNIVIKLKLAPADSDTSVGDLREQLYSFFMPKVPVDLRFYDGSRVVNSSGRVESCVAPLFTKTPGADISIICFDPDFIGLEAVELEGFTVSDTTETLIPYAGTSDTGVLFTLNLDRTETDFTIFHRAPSGIVTQMAFTISLVSGDVVTVSTITGDKYVKLVHSSVETDVLYALDGSNWVTLAKGNNYIRVYATGAEIPYTLSYINRYGGL